MQTKLYYNTVTPLLLSVMRLCMAAKEFDLFRLVGGTALSLQRGHRTSDDIDLFTDASYQSVDFDAIDTWLKTNYEYVETHDFKPIGMGKPYFVGESKSDCIKLDLFHTDTFIDRPLLIDGIRLATIEEIIAMKADVILRGGRKKDFWDLHELIEEYTLEDILTIHERRYPYNHSRSMLVSKLTDFKEADGDFNPKYLQGKHWELIKLDMIEFVHA